MHLSRWNTWEATLAFVPTFFRSCFPDSVILSHSFLSHLLLVCNIPFSFRTSLMLLFLNLATQGLRFRDKLTFGGTFKRKHLFWPHFETNWDTFDTFDTFDMFDMFDMFDIRLIWIISTKEPLGPPILRNRSARQHSNPSFRNYYPPCHSIGRAIVHILRLLNYLALHRITRPHGCRGHHLTRVVRARSSDGSGMQTENRGRVVARLLREVGRDSRDFYFGETLRLARYNQPILTILPENYNILQSSSVVHAVVQLEQYIADSLLPPTNRIGKLGQVCRRKVKTGLSSSMFNPQYLSHLQKTKRPDQLGSISITCTREISLTRPAG